MADVGELKAKIKIDTSDAEKKLKGIKKDFKNTGDAVEKSSRTMSESVFFTLGAIEKVVNVVNWGFKKLEGGLNDTFQISEKIDKTRFFSGISAKDFQNMDDALKSVGVNFSAFEETYSSFDKFLYNFKTFGQISERQAQTYGLLGINPADYENAIDLIEAVSNALLKLTPHERKNMAAELGFNQDFLWALEQGNIKLHEALNLTDAQVESNKKLAQQIQANATLFDKIMRQLSDKYYKPIKETSVGFWGALLTGVENWLSPKENTLGNISFADFQEYKKHGFEELTDSQKKVFSNIDKELRKAGVNDVGIAAVLGNAFAESSFNPNASNGSHTGLFQWDKSRWSNLLGFAKERGMSPYSEVTQTQFLISEMKKRGVFGDIAKATNVKDAVELFEKKIEVSGGQAMENRFGGAISAQSLLSPTRDDFASPLDTFSSSGNNTTINDNHSIVTINTNNETAEGVFDLMKQEKTVASGGM